MQRLSIFADRQDSTFADKNFIVVFWIKTAQFQQRQRPIWSQLNPSHSLKSAEN